MKLISKISAVIKNEFFIIFILNFVFIVANYRLKKLEVPITFVIGSFIL